ncbi:MAG: hypothetical protein HYS53_03070 [Candidatus Aenigmarchaeota archaeon]|nr:hypothetical protein [Candidatus Aenigmarchaeota archaeon]
MKLKRIILDASVLIEAARSRADIFGQIKETFPKSELVTSNSVMSEMREISKGRGRASLAARLVLQLSAKNGIRAVKTESTGDSSLMELCDSESVLITQDRKLRERCAGKGFLSGYLREKRYLMFGREIR